MASVGGQGDAPFGCRDLGQLLLARLTRSTCSFPVAANQNRPFLPSPFFLSSPRNINIIAIRVEHAALTTSDFKGLVSPEEGPDPAVALQSFVGTEYRILLDAPACLARRLSLALCDGNGEGYGHELSRDLHVSS